MSGASTGLVRILTGNDDTGRKANVRDATESGLFNNKITVIINFANKSKP